MEPGNLHGTSELSCTFIRKEIFERCRWYVKKYKN